MILDKYYVCELINEKGIVFGSGFVKAWRWSSPEVAYDALNSDKPAGSQVINFRRVK